jgi:hypothetical protein
MFPAKGTSSSLLLYKGEENAQIQFTWTCLDTSDDEHRSATIRPEGRAVYWCENKLSDSFNIPIRFPHSSGYG